MYVNGEGDCGQLGLGEGQGIVQDPILLPFPYEEFSIVFISAGIGHNSECVYRLTMQEG